MAERVVIAMSGGVDSSVAAARLVRQGWEVVGVTLHLWDYPDDGTARGRCCAPEDVHDARRVSDTLGIPHYAFDRRELFRQHVVDPFVDSYLSGETPSPCVRCNRGVKIRQLLSVADRLGARFVATGHYARIGRERATATLLRAKDREKDQSYFLYTLGPETLERLLFPLGDASKQQVREEALRLELPGATKGESQELCFVATGRYDAFVAERAGSRRRPGPIVDERGAQVGEHDGVFRFTVGQRRNLGVALGRRSYVVGIDADAATVRLGPKEQLLRTEARITDVSLSPLVTLPLSCECVVRYRGTPVQARAEADDAGIRVRFESPVAAVVPGQVVVLFDGDRVLGGGSIVSSRAEAATVAAGSPTTGANGP